MQNQDYKFSPYLNFPPLVGMQRQRPRPNYQSFNNNKSTTTSDNFQCPGYKLVSLRPGGEFDPTSLPVENVDYNKEKNLPFTQNCDHIACDQFAGFKYSMMRNFLNGVLSSEEYLSRLETRLSGKLFYYNFNPLDQKIYINSNNKSISITPDNVIELVPELIAYCYRADKLPDGFKKMMDNLVSKQ